MTFASLEQMAGEVLRCTDCGLCRSRNMAVAGKGSYRSPIVFVGEAPGRSEDIRGEPFVGEAGRRLSAALQHAGISRESVWCILQLPYTGPASRTDSGRTWRSWRASPVPWNEHAAALLLPEGYG